MQDRGAEKEARSPFPVSTISFRLLLEPEHTQRPVIAVTPPTQQSRNSTTPATNQGRTRLKGNQWFLEPFSAFHGLEKSLDLWITMDLIYPRSLALDDVDSFEVVRMFTGFRNGKS
jgi:hypothetical protein